MKTSFCKVMRVDGEQSAYARCGRRVALPFVERSETDGNGAAAQPVAAGNLKARVTRLEPSRILW